MIARRRVRAVFRRSPRPVRWIGRLLVGLAVLLLPSSPGEISALAQDDADDENPYRPGLVAHYRGADGIEHARLEPELAHAWNDNSPDRRVPPGPFAARYRGRLWVQSPGEHRLYVYAAGAVQLSLNGKLLIDARAPDPAWLEAAPVDLPFGFHRLKIEYHRAGEDARLALYWQGPQFGLEPVAARWLFHDAGQTPPDDFERGEQLVRALRCAACHDLPGEREPLRAPALDALAGNLSRAWFIKWLSSTDSSAERRMPHFGYTPDEAAAMADTLFAAALPLGPTAKKQAPAAPRKEREGSGDEPPPPSVAAGQTLFRTTGCLACHRVGELGTAGLFGGGDLARVADKRPADFFGRWLTQPETVNRDHQMPVFALADHELASLSLYLESLVGPRDPVGTAESAHDGLQLIREGRCNACHTLPRSLQLPAAPARSKLAATAVAQAGDDCLAEPDRSRHRPGFRLDERERRAVECFVAGIERVPTARVVAAGRQLMTEHNCLGCHARGSSPGLAASLPALGEADPVLRDRLPALQPPALHGVGDKLHEAALAEAIRVPARRRPWLDVRMPRFRLADDEAASLVAWFIDADRIPPRAPAPEPSARASHSDNALDAAGPRLVTADGFGCTSCHAIGEWVPPKVALNAHGADLSELGRRVRREWFDRWVRNPARIVPQMEMPAVQQSIRGVLDRDLDAQLAAVWRVLNRPGFTPPAPGALRVVRRSNLPDVRERAAVLTDVIEAGGRGFIKPLVLGLQNRHNVLVDLAANRLAAWWIGDTARQQTSGKSWYWEAGGPQLIAVQEGRPPGDLALLAGDARIEPQPVGQWISEPDSWQHAGSGVRFAQRLHFKLDGQTHVVRIVQEFQPLAADDRGAGFRRRVVIERAPSDARFELIVLRGNATLAGRAATLAGPLGGVHVAPAGDASLQLVNTPHGAATIFSADCELEYRAEARPDQFVPLPEIDRSVERAELAVVPGFEAVRLPVTDEAMPTGLAWRSDGTLIVSSLEGRVWLAHDIDRDGLEDKLVPFSDELAAPYGVAAAGDAIDVINKFGLVRLFDADGDGRADRTELLASGWGHTRDYHDWAVGLPRDAAGNYYVSFGSQRDDRTETEAYLRGRVARLAPREPTADDPRRYAVAELAGGFRYPQGLCLTRAGDLFVTDQQGNYTPFNELNHVISGARYGYLNKLEVDRGINPPFCTAAVEIPHPWTRSVNGIAVLDTPQAVLDKRGRNLFGPFEGHLVGCEYTNRRLVRMSLERVRGEFQGAVYPLSIEPTPGTESFEGPLVCSVAPDGDLYVGNIHDSGWGAGANTGSLVRIRAQGELPAGIAEIRAVRDGFSIRFTQPVDRSKAADPASYAVASFRRIATPAYGGDDVDRRQEAIRAVSLADDARTATIALAELREGFVYEFHLRNLSAAGALFFPDEAYYTLRHRLP